MGPLPVWSLSLHVQVEQGAGSALFVPSEWLHTVANLRPCLSVNANWCNQHNLAFCFRRLRRSHASKRARDDVAAACGALASARKAAAMATAFRMDHGHVARGSGSRGSSGSGGKGDGLLAPVGVEPLADERYPPSVLETLAVDPAVALGGKAPFDVEDLVRLLAWKARTILEQHAQAQLQSEGDGESPWPGAQRTQAEARAGAAAAVEAVAGAIAQDPSFAAALRREAAGIFKELSALGSCAARFESEFD